MTCTRNQAADPPASRGSPSGRRSATRCSPYLESTATEARPKVNVYRSWKAPIIRAISWTTRAPMPVDCDPDPHNNIRLESPRSMGDIATCDRRTQVPDRHRQQARELSSCVIDGSPVQGTGTFFASGPEGTRLDYFRVTHRRPILGGLAVGGRPQCQRRQDQRQRQLSGPCDLLGHGVDRRVYECSTGRHVPDCSQCTVKKTTVQQVVSPSSLRAPRELRLGISSTQNATDLNRALLPSTAVGPCRALHLRSDRSARRGFRRRYERCPVGTVDRAVGQEERAVWRHRG